MLEATAAHGMLLGAGIAGVPVPLGPGTAQGLMHGDDIAGSYTGPCIGTSSESWQAITCPLTRPSGQHLP